jgi:hypothetical protein
VTRQKTKTATPIPVRVKVAVPKKVTPVAGEMGKGLAQPVVDALSEARSRYDSPALLDTITALEGLSEILAAVGEYAEHLGAESNRSVRLHSTAESAFDAVASASKQLAQSTESDAASVRSAEAEDIERIENNDPRERQRDLHAHD